MADFFAAHRATLDAAIAACRTRGYWSAYPETPSGRIYGEDAREAGEAAFKALLGKPFPLDQEGEGAPIGAEVSPYGFPLGITYPRREVAPLIAAAGRAGAAWAAATPQTRAGVALEILARLNRDSFLMAHAIQHTTGQAFVMAFQAGGPHAQDRGLEAVAYAFDEMTRIPHAARWEKPQGKAPPVLLAKEWRIVPRGIGLVIGCSTFPTWNGYPGLFASLATGNAVIVKPHPNAILPLALAVRTARAVLREAGFDPDVVQLAPDTVEAPIAAALATHPAIGIVDYTGGPAFGRWLRAHVRDAALFTEEAGINPVVIAGSPDFRGMCANLAFSLALYSGQMCTAPQNLFVPAEGIATDEGSKSFDAIAAGIAAAIDALLADPARAAGVLGAIASPATLARIAAARGLGRVVRDSAPLPDAGAARTATPLLVAVEAEDEAAYLEERFGPIAFLIRCRDADDALARAAASARDRGAITAALYATEEAFIARAADAFARAGVPLSVNLTGGIYVNQSAAFSDYHVSGLNPAGNACLTDSAFVANRFRVAALRRPIAA
ncbi:phenylacetic acid degradation protein PaaN [Elioraea sp.]|uniref:phenylacetic acid degradation protein PaaN n=2 Tax=Elioraea sp. TaxID=2185103 RepID=UPI0021DD7F35|nr:phenylacetic acid degradation protein PaaN [Elioraea sp.]GIX10773.1 MAG: oxidoreductase [Elioraea sp.]